MPSVEPLSESRPAPIKGGEAVSAAPHPPDAGVLYGRHRARVFAFCLSRLRSREENNFTDRMLAIMRNAFGGHAVKKD